MLTSSPDSFSHVSMLEHHFDRNVKSDNLDMTLGLEADSLICDLMADENANFLDIPSGSVV
tara:strand:- start:522 stop:704 length:183 start_codon:yes stop_codon:yes gene_type:complete